MDREERNRKQRLLQAYRNAEGVKSSPATRIMIRELEDELLNDKQLSLRTELDIMRDNIRIIEERLEVLKGIAEKMEGLCLR